MNSFLIDILRQYNVSMFINSTTDIVINNTNIEESIALEGRELNGGHKCGCFSSRNMSVNES